MTLLSRLVINLMLLGVLTACGQATTVGLEPTRPVSEETPTARGAVTVTTAPLTPSLPVAPPPSSSAIALKTLGTTLGTIALRSPGTDLLQALGEPITRTVTHSVGTREWIFQQGLIIDLWGMQDDSPIRLITASPPFDGATAEGFRLGDSSDTFKKIYEDFSIQYSSRTQLAIDDGQGSRLSVEFDASGQAIRLVLEDTKCPQGVSWCS